MQTTIIAASYKGGVILGADTRTSTGSYVANRVTNKITQLAEKVQAQHVPQPDLSHHDCRCLCAAADLQPIHRTSAPT